MNNDQVRKNIEKMISDGQAVLATVRETFGSRLVDNQMARRWATSAVALMISIFGKESEHALRAGRFSSAIHHASDAEGMLGVVQSALDAWDNGYVFELRQLAEAEVESNLIDQAEELLDKSYFIAAAVVAGSVLEQHLRSLCPKYNVPLLATNGKRKTIEPLNQDLCSATAYSKTQQKHITLLGDIRNNAAHGNGIAADDARAIVRDVISLCAKLS